jgi:NAD(P)-dependent dehydrogenase (short-subunit alcohol dehydrogenase family)
MSVAWSEAVVLVTGGTRGIGKAIALRLARERPRHIVLAYCLNHDAARATIGEIKALGVSASAVVCDVSKAPLQREMFHQIEETWGRLDVFVANAARTAFQSAAEIDARSWKRTFELNTEAFLVGTQLASHMMKQRQYGRIVALSSLGSRYFIPKYAALGAAKAALENMARYFAVELSPYGINVNVVCGGFVDTESMKLHPHYEAITREIVNLTPAGRLGRPDDLAGIVAFLCGPEADWIRGQTVIADGGFSLSLGARE